MSAPFLDASVIIRIVTGDDPAKQQASKNLLQAVEIGEQTLFLGDIAVGEAIYVLSSRNLYGLPRDVVANALLVIIRLPGIQMQSKRIMITALELYAQTRIDFADCYFVAAIRNGNATSIYSYDHHFDRFPDVERLEP